MFNCEMGGTSGPSSDFCDVGTVDDFDGGLKDLDYCGYSCRAFDFVCNKSNLLGSEKENWTSYEYRLLDYRDFGYCGWSCGYALYGGV